MSQIRDLYSKVLTKSLLSELPGAKVDALIEKSEVITYNKGERIIRPENPTHMFLHLSGLIHIKNPKTGEIFISKPGRSLELKCLLKGTPWGFDWICESKVQVLKAPWPALRDSLKENKELWTYLSRVTDWLGLQKLNRDIRSLGISRDAVMELVSKMEVMTMEALFSNWNQVFFISVIDANIKSFIEVTGEKKYLAQYLSADSFILNLKNSYLSYDADPKSKVWAISEEKIKTLKQSAELSRLFQFYGYNNDIHIDPEAASNVASLEVESRTVATANTNPGLLQRELITKDSIPKLKLNDHFVVTQADEIHAGSAALATVGLAYGIHLDLSTLDRVLPNQQGSMSLESLAGMAEHVGFKCKVKVRESLLNGQLLPAVLLLKTGLCVLFSVSDGSAVIGNLSTGQTEVLTLERLQERRKDEKVLFLMPSIESKQFRHQARRMGYYLGLGLSSYRWIFLVAASGIIGFFLSLSMPMMNQYVFDVALNQKSKETLIVTLAVAAVILVLSSALTWVSDYFLSYISSHMNMRLQRDVLKNILRMPSNVYQKVGVGTLITRLQDTKQICDYFAHGLALFFVQLPAVLICGTMLFLYHPTIFALALCLLPLQTLVIYTSQKRNSNNRHHLAQVQSLQNKLFIELFSSMGFLKTANSLTSCWWRLAHSSRKLAEANKRNMWIEILYVGAKGLSLEGTRIAYLVISITLFITNKVTFGQILASMLLLAIISSPLFSILDHLFQWSSIRTLIEQMEVVFPDNNSKTRPKEHSALTTSTNWGGGERGIVVKNLSFVYDRLSRHFSLKDISFNIKPGEFIVIVGPSGCGKSTLASILGTLNRPTGGQILVDGISMQDANAVRIKDKISFVSQADWIFAGTIQENITMKNSHPDQNRVAECARLTEFSDFVLSNKLGYAAPLSMGGIEISEGTKQKLALARALYRDASVYILDEATSHMDPISEAKILSQFLDATQGKTRVMLTQRGTLSLRADRVFYMEEGRLIEAGTHFELVKKRGKYFDFFSRSIGA